MALQSLGNAASAGIAFLIGAGIVAEIVAKAVSSPQTTHINADRRAETLMLWVNIGMVEAALIVGIASYFDRGHRMPIIAGAITEGAITYGEYLYAKQAGLRSNEIGTEDYG